MDDAGEESGPKHRSKQNPELTPPSHSRYAIDRHGASKPTWYFTNPASSKFIRLILIQHNSTARSISLLPNLPTEPSQRQAPKSKLAIIEQPKLSRLLITPAPAVTMVLEYFNIKNIRKNKGSNGDEAVKTPILNDEEEKFLHHITSEDPEGTPPPLPERPVIILDSGKEVKGKDAQIALMDGADKIPLPSSPPVDSEGKEIIGEEKDKTKEGEEKKKRNLMSYLSVIPGRSSKVRQS